MKLSVCPLCNSLIQLNQHCPQCESSLTDGGRVSDYLDPYGHYNDIETVKSADGYMYTLRSNLCPHLIYCPQCHYDDVVFIKEQLH